MFMFPPDVHRVVRPEFIINGAEHFRLDLLGVPDPVWFGDAVQPGRVLRHEIVGREPERAELAAVLTDAAHGHGRAVLLLGEAGMGKSTLAEWLVSHASATDVTIARGGCSAAGMPALWPWRRALNEIAPDLPWHDESNSTAQSDREAFAAMVVDAIARQAPQLIVLEDVHWADPLTLLVTRAVADAVPSLPVVLLLTCRDEPDETAQHIRTQLAALPTGVRRMLLPPLDTSGVGQLATNLLDEELTEDEVRELHDRTGGNPFFVHEVLRLRNTHRGQGRMVVPQGVGEVVQRRLARLSQPCAALLALAAVAAETSADLIEDDLLTGADVTALLDEAVAARLLDAVPDGASGYRFRHALIREVLDADLPGAERARLHAIIATRLEQRTGHAVPAARLAHHFSRASGPDASERAAVWSLEAAQDAMAEFGFETAAAHYRRALTHPATDQIAVSIELGEALQLCADTAAARRVLLDAARSADAVGRGEAFARAALALGGGLAGFEVPNLDEEQADLLSRADELLPESALALRAAVRGRLSLARAATLTAGERIALAEDGLRLAHASGDAAVESAVLAAYCDAIAGPDHVAERIVAGARILTLASAGRAGALHGQATVLLARRLLLVAHLENGDLAAADEQALGYERSAARIAIPRYSWLPEVWRAMRALLVGDTEAALRHADEVERRGQRAQSFNAELMALTVRMQAHLDRGTPAEFAAVVEATLNQLGPLGMPAMYLATPARLLLAAGNAEPAHTVLRAFRSGNPQAMPKDAEWLESHWAMIDIAIELDDRIALAGLYDALLPYAGLWAVDGIGGVLFGSVAEQLSVAAGRLGHREDEARFRSAAREQYLQHGTSALLGRIDAASSGRPSAASGTGRMQHDGSTWRLDWQGRQSTVADAKGLHDLAILLARPGQAIPALQLVEAAGGPPAAAAGADLGPVIDDAARNAYRRRLDQLDSELEAAETAADLGRVERLRTERTMLIDELSAAFGLGGRPRIVGDPAERARKAVTMRIRAAIRSIEAHDDALARHLRNAVHTGRLCSYEPEAAVTWQT